MLGALPAGTSEDLGVKLGRPDREQIAAPDPSQRRLTVHAVGIERPAQPQDRHVQALERSGPIDIAPQRVDQPVIGQRAVGVAQQQRQQRQLARPPTATLRSPSHSSTGPRIEYLTIAPYRVLRTHSVTHLHFTDQPTL